MPERFEHLHAGQQDDPFRTAQWRDMERRAQAELVPKMKSCGTIVQLVPRGPTDVKFAMELGLGVMLDKPIIALVYRGTQMPAKLLKLVDEVIVYDVLDDSVRERVEAAILRLDRDV